MPTTPIHVKAGSLFLWLFPAIGAPALAQQSNDTSFYSLSPRVIKSICIIKGDERHTRLYYESGKLKQEINEQVFPSEEIPAKENGKPVWKLHGSWKSWYPSGRLSQECTYKQGLLNGTNRQYFENGALKDVRGYKVAEVDGKLTSMVHGSYLRYSADGKKQEEGSYTNNKKEGKETEWYASGNKKRETTYRAGYKMGPSSYWFESGKLASSGSYDTLMHASRNAKPYASEVQSGHWKTWYQGGAIQNEGDYIKGKKHGRFVEWYENGQKKSEVDYDHGNTSGSLKSWFQNGQLQRSQIRTIQRGRKNGEIRYVDEGRYEEYNEAGKPIRTGSFKDGKKTGKWLQYSGEVITEESDYVNGLLIGQHTQRYNNGNLMRQETYKAFRINGRDTTLPDGEQVHYSEKGRVVFSVVNEKGRQLPATIKQYHENGNLQSEVRDLGDRYQKIEYYDNGVKQRELIAAKDPAKTFEKLNFVPENTYDTEGHLRKQVSFNKGTPQGYAARWNEDGTLTGEAYIFNDPDQYPSIGFLKHSWNAEYYSNGQPHREVYIVNYFLGGYEVEWYVTGELKRVQQFGISDLQWLQNGQLMDASYYDPKNQNIRLDSVGDPRQIQEIYNRFSRPRNKIINLATAPDGIARSYYDESQVRFEGEVINHRFDHFFRGYFPNGKLMVEWNLKQGVPHGRYTLMNVNGTLRETGNFTNGKPSGFWRVNNTLGQPNYECLYDSSDASGKHLVFRKEYAFETGKLKKLESYKNGQPDGLQQTWSDQGVLTQQYTITNGKTSGLLQYWWANGNPYRKSVYNAEGKQDGLDEQFYENGRPQWKINYADGKQHGSYRSWWKNGQLWAVGHFAMGEKDSVWVTYDSLGVLKSELTFANGKAQLPSSTDPCRCTEPERKISFAPWLADIVDSTKFMRWQFPFHEKLKLDLKSFFFGDYMPSYSGDHRYSSFTLFAYKPIEVKFPDSKGLSLVLNPCHQFSGSRIPVSAHVSVRDPNQTRITLNPKMLAFRFDTTFLKPIDSSVPACKATFSVSSLDYEATGITLHDPTAQCFNVSRIGKSPILLSVEHFEPAISLDRADIGGNAYDHSKQQRWFSEHLESNFTGLYNGSGQLSCEIVSAASVSLPIKNLVLNNQLLVATVSVAAKKTSDGSFNLSGTKGKQNLGEAALKEFFRKHGFETGDFSYNEETHLLTFNLTCKR